MFIERNEGEFSRRHFKFLGAVAFPGAMAVGDELSVFVELLNQGRTSLKLRAEAIARERDGAVEKTVAEGEFTFVALDQNNQPRVIAAKEESNG